VHHFVPQKGYFQQELNRVRWLFVCVSLHAQVIHLQVLARVWSLENERHLFKQKHKSVGNVATKWKE
jgi:hypothetical protein